MKKVLIIVLLLLCLSSDRYIKTNNNIVSYDQFIHLEYERILTQKNNQYHVYIYYPQCQYCQELLPLFINKIKKEQNYVIFFVKIDATIPLSRSPNPLPICQREQFNINGFPLLLEVRNGCIINLFLGRTRISNAL